MIAKEHPVEMGDLARIAAGKLDQLNGAGLVCHMTFASNLPSISSEGLLVHGFAKRIHKEDYCPIYNAPQNETYVSVSNAWGTIHVSFGDILLFIKTSKPVLDLRDTESNFGIYGVELLIKHRVSPKEFVGIGWFGKHHESFRRTFEQVVEEVWTNRPELAVPIYQCTLSNPLNHTRCPGLSQLQIKVLWPTNECPRWLNWY